MVFTFFKMFFKSGGAGTGSFGRRPPPHAGKTETAPFAGYPARPESFGVTMV
jgi:hypothetical protein